MPKVGHEEGEESKQGPIVAKSLTARYNIGLEPGPGYQRGFILSEIIRYILNYKDGVEEPKIREYLFKEYKIKNLKTIKDHLEKLRLEELIVKKEKSGRSNMWVLNYSNRDTLAKYLITEFLSKGLFITEHIGEERKKIMDLYKTEGIQQFIKENNFSRLFYFSLIIGIFGILPDRNKDWKKIGINSDISHEDKIIIEDALDHALFVSPTLFIHLYYPLIEVKLIFWDIFDKTLLKDDDPQFILKMSYHLIFSALILDSIKFHDNEIPIKFIETHHYTKEVRQYFKKLNAKINEMEQIQETLDGIAKKKVEFTYS